MYSLVHFRYTEKYWSLYYKPFNIGTAVFFFLNFLGYLASDASDAIYVLLIEGIIYMLFVLRTYRIWRKRQKFKRYGRKCNGVILNLIIKEDYSYSYDTGPRHTNTITLLVQYANPITGEVKIFETPEVNGNPFTYLSSLDVTVYVLPDGSAWATDFKWIRSIKEGWEFKNKELAKNIKPIYRK